MLIRSLFLFMLALAAGGASAATPRLLVLGDSLSSGYGIAPGSGWVDLLARRLADSGHDYRVVNASISGDTTAGGLRRLPALLDEHRPDVVIIELGANDGLRGLPLATIRRNLAELVATAAATARAVVVVGVRMPPNYGPRYADAFHALFAAVAEQVGTALAPRLLDGVGDNFDLIQADGLHPTAAAQPRLLDNVWPALVPLLTPQG